jgi:sugar phosphate isomerase/epimerase
MKRSATLLLALTALVGFAPIPARSEPPGLPNAFYAMDTYTKRPYPRNDLTPAAQFDMLKELGYAGIAWTEEPAGQVASAVKEAEARGLKMFAIYFGGTVTPDGQFKTSPAIDAVIDVLKGHDTLIWLHIGGRGPRLADLKADGPIVASLRHISEHAAAAGLQVAIYPHIGDWTEHVSDAVKVARLVGRPNFGVTFNLCHTLAVGDEERIPSLLEAAKPYLKTVTINGADSLVGKPDWSRLIQTLDRGSFDVAGVLRLLRKQGFKGPIGIQGYGIGGDRRDNLERSMGAWRKLSAAAAGDAASSIPADTVRLESPAVLVEIDPETGGWSLLDKTSGVRWPSEGRTPVLKDRDIEFRLAAREKDHVDLAVDLGGWFLLSFRLVDGKTLVIRCATHPARPELRLLDGALRVTDREQGALIVPCREGLLIPADSGVAFRHTFGASEYEGCHMNMIGLLKGGAALVVDWDGSDVWADVESQVAGSAPDHQAISTSFRLTGQDRKIRLTPQGKGNWNTVAAAYRKIAEKKGLASTLRQKIARDPHTERLLGAANVKLWQCLARRMNDDSSQQVSVRINWTFDEAAQVAEHIRNDLGIDRCLFTIGGWTEGGYDVRHPDALPANPECGGNAALADAVKRIQGLGYVASLHDNYQDIYKDAKSWSPDLVQKKRDGSLSVGGRWMGGQAYLVCATNQVELARRPQNMPSIKALFGPWSYFIDTTYAVGPQECFDPKHPLGRDDDIAAKSKLSDLARDTFGLFGSECGREWALPHSDFFEGLTGVSGKSFHNLEPESLGARVIPFWEMVYHDCQVCYGKYGYPASQAGEYVAHHILCARPLNYHSVPNHLYWKNIHEYAGTNSPKASFTRTDQGWAAGLHPADVFLKNTHEVLGPLNRATAFDRLTKLEFLTPRGEVRRATYGEGPGVTVVVVNFGDADATVDSELGGSVILPPYGFVVEGPRFAAFFAKRWKGRDYDRGALFTFRPEQGDILATAHAARIFHGFGDPRVEWDGTTCEVRTAAVVALRK